MPAYFQMGYQSDNLITCTELDGYRGAILSPVDYKQVDVRRIIENCKVIAEFETIFDPQLYFPRTERARLREWTYFPNDVDTADLSKMSWWKHLISDLKRTADELHLTAMCSPITNPRVFSNECYSFMVDVGCEFFDHINPLGIKVYQTIIVNLPDLSDNTQVLSIASIISRTKASSIYLIFKSETTPRRELSETSEISGAMLLIRTLENSGIRVLVGFCSTDVILWKEAGASNCASGKFFNLRRFTPSRWNLNEEGGGGQLPYWFEESLMAFLREPDFIRTQRAGIISESTQQNPYLMEINECLRTGTPWLSLGWRQYLWWFQNIESRFSTKAANAIDLLKIADMNWSIVDKQHIIFDERRNDGSWIRAWMKAVTE